MGRIYITSTCERCGAQYQHRKGRKQRFCSSECCARARWQKGCSSPTDAFWARVNKNGPTPEHMPHLGSCWVWTAGCFKEGYGKMRWGGRATHAHRLSWMMHNGPIPVDKPCVLHHCDNPPCVRPDHLWLGSRTDNNVDMYAKGRANPWGHKLPLLILALLLFATPASAQHPFIRPDTSPVVQESLRTPTDKDSLTVAPKDDRFNWTFALGSLGYWGSFAADIKTTKGSLARGSLELNPIFGHERGHKVRYTANAVATAGIYGIAVYCERRGHRRFARVLLYTGAAIRTAAAVWNFNRRR